MKNRTKRNHTKSQNSYIQKLKYLFVTAQDKKTQDKISKKLENIEFF